MKKILESRVGFITATVALVVGYGGGIVSIFVNNWSLANTLLIVGASAGLLFGLTLYRQVMQARERTFSRLTVFSICLWIGASFFAALVMRVGAHALYMTTREVPDLLAFIGPELFVGAIAGIIALLWLTDKTKHKEKISERTR